MPAFKKLGPGDQIDNVLVLEPQYRLVSGSSGWRGSPEDSGSLNLYGGYARATASLGAGGTLREIQYEPINPAQRAYGALKRSMPITASVDVVWMTDEDLNITQRTRNRWGHEHWKTVMGLYDYYSRRDPDYTTASYDHYCLFFVSGSNNIVTYMDRTATAPNRFMCLPTASFTVEAWFKPFVSGSPGNDLTIVSRRRSFKLKVDGGSGKLVFAKYDGTSTTVPTTVITGTNVVTPCEWHHVAVSYDSTTATMYLDLSAEGSASMTALVSPINYTGSFHIGAEWGGTVTTQGGSVFEDVRTSAVGSAGTVFHGFIGETRVWGQGRTSTQLSASYNHRLTGSELGAPLLAQFRLSEGPLTNCVPDTDPSGLQWVWDQGTAQGSGTINWSANYKLTVPEIAQLWGFEGRNGPVWHPNDNTNFYLPKQYALTHMSGVNWGSGSAPVERLKIINVPEAFHGRGIVPGSVRITDNAWSGTRRKMVRTLIDDGRGGLFLSGSACSSSFEYSTTAARATGVYVNSPGMTSSLYLEARLLGAQGNGMGWTSVGFQPDGITTFGLTETNPHAMTLNIPVDGLSNPIGTMWQLYQFINSSSIYLRAPNPPVGDMNELVGGSTMVLLGGGANGDTDASLEPTVEQYRGVEWNKVGNVFYEHGLIVIKDPAMLDVGEDTTAVTAHPNDLLQIDFRGQTRVPVKTVVARVERGELNCSLNPTYYTTQEDGYRAVRHPSASLYVTTVGLYNSDRELVGVARLAEPLRIRPRDRFAIKIRMDF